MLGQEFFNHVVKVTVPAGGSESYTLRSPGYDVWVDSIVPEIYHDYELIKEIDAQDLITVQIEDVGNTGNLFASAAIPISGLNKVGRSDKFKGFKLGGDSFLKFDLAHNNTAGNFTGVIDVYLIFSGSKISDRG